MHSHVLTSTLLHAVAVTSDLQPANIGLYSA